ncbi:hypothetical protein A8B75_17935 [Sphingomonadales bacterium EhC05]|nr:hypothetical protein A8B75_17935 [Sphingomonadales bacterium EhC05]
MSLIGVALATSSTAALAQSGQSQSDHGGVEDKGGISVIAVTVTKRSENLQDVPVRGWPVL